MVFVWHESIYSQIQIRDDKAERLKLFKDALMRRGWRLGNKFRYQTPFNDSNIGVGYSDAEDSISFPVVFMYPQYRQSDLVQMCLETDTLNKWLEKLFPKGQPPQPWDTDRLFVHSNLPDFRVYCKTNDFDQHTLKQKWLKVDPALPLGQILSSDPEYVIPKWPVFFVVLKDYEQRFLALDPTKIS